MRTGIYGLSANPSTIFHLEAALRAAGILDRVVVVPCGNRTEKPTTNDIPSLQRAIMAGQTFGGIAPNVIVDNFDLESKLFTRTHKLDRRYKEMYGGEIFHIVGADLVAGGHKGESVIQKDWQYGKRIWKGLNWAVLGRPGYDLCPADLPPNHILIEMNSMGSSTEVRELAFRHRDFSHLVTPKVADHIARYGLYCGGDGWSQTLLELEEIRPFVAFDTFNEEAVKAASKIKSFSEAEANCILVLGGDRTMMRTVRGKWHLRLPFIGINFGGEGYHLNNAKERIPEFLKTKSFKCFHLPLLEVKRTRLDGSVDQTFAFNNAWADSVSGLPTDIEVTVDNQVVFDRLRGDGVLIATAAGSTAYAKNMGAIPTRIGTNSLIMVGSNSSDTIWKMSYHPLSTKFSFRVVGERRPMLGFVDYADSVPWDQYIQHHMVTQMEIKTSNIASAELAFWPDQCLDAKLRKLQFPWME